MQGRPGPAEADGPGRPPSPLASVTSSTAFASGRLASAPALVPLGEAQALTISLSAGWNWVSLNVQPIDPSMASLLVTSPAPATNDLVKSALLFSQWDSNQWVGSLKTWDAEQTHLLKMSSAATFTAIGPLLTSVTVNPGWNWIAFASPTDLPSLEAIAHTGGFADGDLLKSASAFTRYDGTAMTFVGGGSLATMEVGKGYLLKCTNGGIITFGSFSSRRRRLTTRVVKPESPAVDDGYGIPAVGSTTASLTVSLSIDGAQHSSGRMAAFSAADGRLLGVQAASVKGKFHLSVASPHDLAARPSDKDMGEVRFEHTDDGGSTRKIPLTYKYVANDMQELSLSA